MAEVPQIPISLSPSHLKASWFWIFNKKQIKDIFEQGEVEE